MFLEKDERLIIIDIGCSIDPVYESGGVWRAFTISELQSLEKVGVKTIWFGWRTWLHSDWQIIYDEVGNILENTNLKILLPFFDAPPDDTWLLDGNIDYVNPDVGKSIDEVTLKFIDQFSYAKDRVQLIYSYMTGGEFVWLKGPGSPENANVWPLDPPLSSEIVAEFIVERQKILSAQHDEVWTSLHDILGYWSNEHLNRPRIINEALYAEFPGCEHYRVQYSYFRHMVSDHARSYIKNNPRSKYFVGSDYAEGLITNFDEGLELGIWGFVTAPIIAGNSEQAGLEDWQLENIETTIKRFGVM